MSRTPKAATSVPFIELTMENIVKANLLRYECGHKMVCPGCKGILDCARAVSADVLKNGMIAKSYIRCAACFDSAKPGLEKAIADTNATEPGWSLDITDGRTINWRLVPRR